MAQSVHITKFIPNPIQRQFIESRARADLFSSRRGEGKTSGIAWAILHHTRHNPGAEWAVVRDTFENLQRTTQKTFFEWFPPGIYGTYHQTKKQFTWAEGAAQGVVNFIGMDDPSRAASFQSWELAGVAIDEPSPATGNAGIDEIVFDLGLTSLRQPGMNWYAMKLAQNNPDETHWTYRRFVDPGAEGFVSFQPVLPENMKNLPENYYAEMRKDLAHRPDLVRRFVDGEYGFQQEGVAVTPQWNDKIHLSIGLIPIPGKELICLWDFGLNPTCVVTQVSPMGHWLILDSMVGDGIGTSELIADVVKPLLQSARYEKCRTLRHIGDPAGQSRDQSSSRNTAVSVIRQELGGPWRDGPVKWPARRDAIGYALSRTVGGVGMVQVDRMRAKEVWQALRGGWHYHKARTGLISGEARKNMHSHPGDAMSYGAAILFPPGKVMAGILTPGAVSGTGYFGKQTEPELGGLGPGGNGPQLGEIPRHGEVLGAGINRWQPM